MNNEYKGVKYSSMATPWISVDNPQYVWRSAAETDVQRTWRAHGWKPHNDQGQGSNAQEKQIQT